MTSSPGSMKEFAKETLAGRSSKTKYQIVLTKTDLSFPVDVARRAMQIEESLKTKKSAIQPLMMVSSKTGAGIRSLRTMLSNVSRFARL
ncbi:hypothetical protein Hanom_Chr01g00056911 [Helianthus anomalus]